MSDKYDKIIEGLGELKGTTSAMNDSLSSIRQDVNQNTRDLAEHIAGVKTNSERLTKEIEYRDEILAKHEEASQERFKEIDERLKIVEFLPNLLTSAWKVLKWLGAAAAAVVAITKFMGLW